MHYDTTTKKDGTNMKFDDAVARIVSNFPDAIFDVDGTGEITVSIGMRFHPHDMTEIIPIEEN